MNIKRLIISLSLVCTTCFASAATYTVAGQLGVKTLTLDIKETEAIAPGCDLYVQNFTYYPDFKYIDIGLREVKNCPLDNIAPRSAQLIWNFPFNFAAEKQIFLKINRRTVGTLHIENQNIVFKPRGTK